MANWKKVIVSGSSAELAALHVDGLSSGVVTGASGNLTTTVVNGTGNILATTGATGVSITGSFSGPLAGNADTATSASYAANSTSASYAANATSASQAANAVSASYAANATSASYAVNATTASHATSGNGTFSGSFSGSFVGDGSGLTGLVTELDIAGDSGTGVIDLKTQSLTIQGTSNEINTSVSGQVITIGLPDDVTITDDLNVGGDLVVTGNLNVNGTTTIIDTTNLLIEDKFALFASGSTTATDGGFVIQSNVDGSGYAFGYDASSDRWALEDGISGTATVFSATPTAFVATVEVGTSTPASPAYGGSTGYGNIFVNTSNSDIWIYA